jgi:hypothetical protein
MASSYEYAFPALDSRTVQNLNPSDPASTLQGLDNNTIIHSIQQINQDNMIQAMNLTDSSSQNILTYGELLSRNQTLTNIANDLTLQNELNSQKGNRDTLTRQSQINEWEAQNKLDTLFFLQILFLFFIVTVILLYIRRAGFLPLLSFYIFEGLALSIVIGTLWNRSTYTSRSRDNKYWNRRYFTMGDGIASGPKVNCNVN